MTLDARELPTGAKAVGSDVEQEHDVGCSGQAEDSAEIEVKLRVGQFRVVVDSVSGQSLVLGRIPACKFGDGGVGDEAEMVNNRVSALIE